MASIQDRLKQLEDRQRFIDWFLFDRFLESLTREQLETFAHDGRLPEPLPEPLPKGASRLDGLDRKSLIKLWEESERMFRHEAATRWPFTAKPPIGQSNECGLAITCKMGVYRSNGSFSPREKTKREKK